MNQREAFEKYKQFNIPSLSIICEKISQYFKTCLLIIIILFVFIYLIQEIPQWQVAQFGITNPKDLADAENSYRATLAQILGGIAIGIGLYYTWRRVTIAEKELKVSQEGQITERFTRAVDQLGAVDHFGNPALEIRLGGIYALERISKESKRDYWPIMEILTAYVRKNSSADEIQGKNSNAACFISMDIQANESRKKVPDRNEIPLDIQAIITVLGRRKHTKHTYEYKESESVDLKIYENLDLSRTFLNNLCLMDKEAHFEGVNFVLTHLEGAYLNEAHLEGAQFNRAHLGGAYLNEAHLEETSFLGTHLEGANLERANLEGAHLLGTHLEGAYLLGTHLEGAYLYHVYLEGADLTKAHLEWADLEGTNLEGANLEGANLEGAYLKGAHLERVENLTIEQLSKVTTLYNATIDEELLIQLKDKFPALFEKSDYNPY